MTSSTQLTVVAILRARPGLEDELGQRLRALIEPTRAEPGCVNYDLHRSNTEPAVWLLYENWKTAADLDTHFAMDYLVNLLADFDRLLQGELQIHRLSMVSRKAS